LKTRKLMAILVMVAMIVTALPMVAFAGPLDYSAAASTVTVNKTKVDVSDASDPEVVKFTVRFREGTAVVTEEVEFFVKSNRDAEVIDEVNDAPPVMVGAIESGAKITATPDDRGMVTFEVYSGVAGDAKISVYKFDDTSAEFDVDDALLIGEKTITFEADDDVEEVYLDIDYDGSATAGKKYDLIATVYDESNNWVEDEEVTFYQYFMAPGKSYGSRKNLGTATTDSQGEAELSVRLEKAGTYAFYAKANGVDSADDKPSGTDEGDCLELQVDAASAYSVQAKSDVKYAELKKQVTVSFIFKDRYGSRIVDIDDDVEVFDPDDDEVTSGISTSWDYDDEEFDVKFTPKEEGEYIVRAYIPDTGIYAETIVNTAEFEDAERIALKLYDDNGSKVDNAAIATDADADIVDEYEVRVYEYDENDVERLLDASDVYFSTSDPKVITIGRDGFITVKEDATGVVTITAIHAESELSASIDITVSGVPVDIDVQVAVDGLEAEVEMQFVDENGNLAVEEEEGYRVIAGDLDVVEVEDFDNGKASFVLEAEEYGSYDVRVVTDEGIATSFTVDFVDGTEPEVEGAEKVVLTIGSNMAVVDGVAQEFDAPAFIEEGRTYVPFRFIAEAFGAEVDWTPKDGLTETVFLTRDDMEVSIGIGDSFLTVTTDGEAEVQAFDGAAQIVEGRTFLPFRAIAEAFGAEVDYGPADGPVEWVSFQQ
jgi:hypothetical protein